MRQIMLVLRGLILQQSPKIEEAFKWRVPFYSYQGMLCFMNPVKGRAQGRLEVGFYHGNMLSNAQGLLVSGGKMVHHAHLYSLDELLEKEAAYRELLQEAMLLNETIVKEKLPVRAPNKRKKA